MSKKRKALKIIGIVLASIAGFCVVCHGALMTWIRVTDNNDIPLFIHNGIKSLFFIDNENDEVKEFKTKVGGVMRGVCHPHDEPVTLQKMEEANINWVRYDLPGFSPIQLDENYDPIIVDGEYVPSLTFVKFLEESEYFKTFNQKLLIITPGLEDMLENVGESDVFKFGGEFSEKFINYSKICARFYAEKLSTIASGFQICNETEIPKWRGALTTEQVVYFIGDVMMKEMHDTCAKNNCVIGFNQSMLGNYKLANGLTEKYSQYFDYVGVDLYPGSFEPYLKFMWVNDFYVKYLYYVTRKPIIITEFGYIGHGESKSDDEKEQYLRNTFGERFDTEDKIKNDFVNFLGVFNIVSRTAVATSKIEEIEFQLNSDKYTEEEKVRILNQVQPFTNVEDMKKDKLGLLAAYERNSKLDKTCGLISESYRIMQAGGYSKESIDEAIDFFFLHGKSHLYKTCDSSIGLIGYDHTEEGQAKYLRDFVRRISKKKYVCGFFVYHLLEDNYCYECGQDGCPVETGWGLMRIQTGTTYHFDSSDIVLKQSYYAIKEVYGELKNADSK